MIQNSKDSVTTETKSTPRGRAVKEPKTTTDRCLSLDILKLKRWGYFKNPTGTTGEISWMLDGERTQSIKYTRVIPPSGNEFFQLEYNFTNNKGQAHNVCYGISITSSPCHFGGVRHWFICPCKRDGKPCGRRTRILYQQGPTTYFSCRQCGNLTYRSCLQRPNLFYKGFNPPIDRFLDLERRFERARSPKKMEYLSKKIRVELVRVERVFSVYGRSFHKKIS